MNLRDYVVLAILVFVTVMCFTRGRNDPWQM